jgi:hypothetical protein
MDLESSLFKRPPTRIPDELKALFLRIAADPASATRADRNKIFGEPPPDEEDRLCKEKTGSTMEELKNKGLTNPDTLTEDECDILMHGTKLSGKDHFWKYHLLDDERQLVDQVHEILWTDDDTDMKRNAYRRSPAFDDVREERREKKKQDRAAAQAAKWRAARPQWVNHMLDAKLSQWGFVIFRTAYSEGTEQKWLYFQRAYSSNEFGQLRRSWKFATHLSAKHKPFLVCDPSLEGADPDVLRRQFKTMRERNEIPDGIATDCFLVADQTALDQSTAVSMTDWKPKVQLFVADQTALGQSAEFYVKGYKPKAPGEPDPWESTFSVRAVNPDYDTSVLSPSEGDLAGYEGEITIPLPKIFDWLYYCFFAKSEDWETRYKVVKGGPAEQMVSRFSLSVSQIRFLSFTLFYVVLRILILDTNRALRHHIQHIVREQN